MIAVYISIFNRAVIIHVLKQGRHACALIVTLFSLQTAHIRNITPYLVGILNWKKWLVVDETIQNSLSQTNAETGMTVLAQRVKSLQCTFIARATIIPFSIFSVRLLMAAGNSYLIFSPTLQIRFFAAGANRAVTVIYVLICKYLSAISTKCFHDFRKIVVYSIEDQSVLFTPLHSLFGLLLVSGCPKDQFFSVSLSFFQILDKLLVRHTNLRPFVLT